jgi:hypothetical protein
MAATAHRCSYIAADLKRTARPPKGTQNGYSAIFLLSARAAGGHAPGDLRDAFPEAWDIFNDWNVGDEPQPTVELRDRKATIDELCGVLWNCTDILPGYIVSDIKDMDMWSRRHRRFNYASMARELKDAVSNK